jgi:hypothetical protein
VVKWLRISLLLRGTRPSRRELSCIANILTKKPKSDKKTSSQCDFHIYKLPPCVPSISLKSDLCPATQPILIFLSPCSQDPSHTTKTQLSPHPHSPHHQHPARNTAKLSDRAELGNNPPLYPIPCVPTSRHGLMGSAAARAGFAHPLVG